MDNRWSLSIGLKTSYIPFFIFGVLLYCSAPQAYSFRRSKNRNLLSLDTSCPAFDAQTHERVLRVPRGIVLQPRVNVKLSLKKRRKKKEKKGICPLNLRSHERTRRELQSKEMPQPKSHF
ncbi:hypothetical protein M885DRAFT_22096 [Pelagophyceae sp. CCMP2097]|nr:hypothetical protein M885DRAFT_22096 [Pelagophyceae sp. CCMP2097]